MADEDEEDYFAGAPQPPTRAARTDSIMIRLTPAQTRHVEEQTGRTVTEFPREDSKGFVAMTMASRDPDEVTLWAIKWARAENDFELAYQAYLLELAEWQDTRRHEEKAKQDKLEEDALAKAEALAASFEEFYAEEGAAREAAMEEAIEAWDPDGKKRKKGIEPG